jgi:hypothetical protein
LQASPDVGIAILLTLLFSTPFEPAPFGLAPVCALLPTRTGDPMKSIRNFAYTAVLTLSALNFVPSLASAQDAAGTFTLTHDVHWQNAVVPAGVYRFTVGADGPAEMLTLRKLTGSGAGFMLLVTDVEASQPSGPSQLLVVPRTGGSFVSTMKLPEFGMTLHFAVPAERREVARAGAIPGTIQTASAGR